MPVTEAQLEFFQRRAEVWSLITNLRPMRSRSLKIKRQGTPEKTYSWLVNVWVPSQPDADELKALAYLLNMDIKTFIKALEAREVLEYMIREKERGIDHGLSKA